MILRALLVMGLLGVAGCSKFQTYDGPEVTRVVLMKSDRRMYLMHHDQVLRAYDTSLGFAPEGPKRHEGDGRTPEGRYFVNRRNPDSRYHLSIGIDYPRPRDLAVATALGVPPGGDIFIHGTPRQFLGTKDWTQGCVAIADGEMEQVYAMVADGTPVDIFP